MKYSYLGNSGLIVSRVCLGTATFGQKDWGCDKNDSVNILNQYANLGGNFIDTADQYGNTASESIIGQWLKEKQRSEFVIASKCFFKTGNDINSKGLSRKHIIDACETSLKRLKTDYLDLYQLHNQDPKTPLEETLYAMDHLVRQGKVRYIGLSNYPAWKIIKIYGINERNNFVNFTSGQFLYNLLKRDIEKEILPACSDAGIGVMCWSPLSGGMLTGKYFSQEKPPNNSRFHKSKGVDQDKYQQWLKKSNKIIQKLLLIAKEQGQSPSVVSLSWLLKNKNIASVIIGANKPKHIQENMHASTWVIPDEAFIELDRISKPALSYPDDIFKNTTKDWLS